ncbi:MAG: TRAP transporter substrate-binding protein [Treponema sp.]|nr:TRAP transporter substrate-binding protein [Treponema sp.]
MKKSTRLFICVLTLAGVVFGFVSCQKKEGGQQAKPRTITLAHNQTSLENPYSYGAIKFKQAAESVSGGALNVIVHHGTLGENENELVEKLEMGAVDIINVSPGFMSAIGVPEVDMLSMPYLFNSFEHWNAALDGEFGKTMTGLIAKKTGDRFMVLGYWTASVRDYYGKKPVSKPADLQGMTLRGQSAQVQQDFWKACGATPVSIAWGELYQALQQGVVDSAENDYTNFMLKEHHKTPNGKYISETHHDFTTRLFMTSGAFWSKLSDQEKLWIKEAADAATKEEREVTIRMSDESKAKVIADGAVVTDFAGIDIEAFRSLAIPIQDAFAQKNNMGYLLEMARSVE